MASVAVAPAVQALLTAFVVCLAGCANSNRLECTAPRAEICTKEYRPVCATRDNGVRCVTTPCDSTEQATYPNPCLACADEAVYYYEPGRCGDDPGQ